MALWFPNKTFESERRQLNETNTIFLSSASPGENLLKATQTLYTCMSIEGFLFICRVHIHSVGSRLCWFWLVNYMMHWHFYLLWHFKSHNVSQCKSRLWLVQVMRMKFLTFSMFALICIIRLWRSGSSKSINCGNKFLDISKKLCRTTCSDFFVSTSALFACCVDPILSSL